MRRGLPLVIALASTNVFAGPPEYSSDPFDDYEFSGAPLILDVSHPSQGRGSIALLFNSSLIDKYTNHLGATLQFDYNITDTMGAALSVSFLHGTLTPIVSDEGGIIPNHPCMGAERTCAPGEDITPSLPDYDLITSSVDGLFVWSPLYGKVNLVSELDVNLQFYIAAGAGVHGTRRVAVTFDPSAKQNYGLSGDGFGDGGFLSGAKFHMTADVGLQIFLLGWLSLRVEARGLLFVDEFVFENDLGPESYLSQVWFLNTGVGFILF